MCSKRNSVLIEKRGRMKKEFRADLCIRDLLIDMQYSEFDVTLAHCCGHGRYPRTIVMQNDDTKIITELFSGKIIPRKRRFYKKDEDGYYYIPEVL